LIRIPCVAGEKWKSESHQEQSKKKNGGNARAYCTVGACTDGPPA
jgi:hypothetical protein